MLMETEAGIWARADAQVFRLLMDGDRSPRRLLAADRTIASAIRRVAALRQRRAAQDAREYAAADRRLAREFKRAWGRAIRVRVEPTRAGTGAKPERRDRAVAPESMPRRTIRAYTAPIKDARSRVAVYFRIRYLGLKSKGWRTGLAADHILYILRDGAQEDTALEHPLPLISNMGTTAEEIAAAWRLLEAMEEGYRANAKVQYRIVWNLPHNLAPDQRHALVEDFCERTFGRPGLPYVAAIHTPDPKGDARNVHAHIAFSTRPLERVGDHQWLVAQEKVNGLTDPAGLTLMRALAAGHMNRACRAAGHEVRFTHETYTKRGIDAVRQTHLGPARVAAHERGRTVAAVARNAEIVARNEVAIARDGTAEAFDVAAKLADALQRQIAGDDEQRRVAGMARAVKAIASRAESLALLQRPQPLALQPARPQRVAAQAQKVAWKLANSAEATAAFSPTVIAPVANQWRAAHVLSRIQAGHRATLTDAAGRLATIRQRVTDSRAAESEAVRKRLNTLLMGSKTPPYTVREGRLILDVSMFDKPDAAFILTADRNLLGEHVRERYRRDRARELAAADALLVAEEQRIAEAERARKREAELRERERAERLRREAEALSQAEAASAVEAALAAIEEERILILYEDERARVDAAVLERFGVAAVDFASEAAQARLDAIANRQQAELEPVIGHAITHGEHIVRDRSGWTLSPNAPAHLRRIADAWVHEPNLQRSFAKAAATWKDLTRQQATVSASKAETDQLTRLVAAARQREALTNRWRQTRRLDGVHAAPGTDVSAAEAQSVSLTRRPRPEAPSRER